MAAVYTEASSRTSGESAYAKCCRGRAGEIASAFANLELDHAVTTSVVTQPLGIRLAVKVFVLSALLVCAALRLSGATVAPLRYQPALDQAFSHLYSSDFDGAHAILNGYIGQNPNDPVGYAVRGSAYLFFELDRLGILESEFFEDNGAITDKKKVLRPDPKVRDLFYAAIGKAQSLGKASLQKNPDDTNALFALCLASGNLTDYVALIEKHQMQSLAINKEGYRYAKHLLQIAPDFYDAYLTTGFTEYLIGSIPLVFRWFVKFDDVQGDKNAGVKKLEVVARDGHYLKPFAKILLATADLRAKRYGEARALLVQLTQSYPQNPLLRRELDRLSARM